MRTKIALIIAVIIQFASFSQKLPNDLRITSYVYSTSNSQYQYRSQIKVFEINNTGKKTYWMKSRQQCYEYFDISNIYNEFFRTPLFHFATDPNCSVGNSYGLNFYKILEPGDSFRFILYINERASERVKKSFKLFSNKDLMQHLCFFVDTDIYNFRNGKGALLKSIEKDNPIAFFPYKEIVLSYEIIM